MADLEAPTSILTLKVCRSQPISNTIKSATPQMACYILISPDYFPPGPTYLASPKAKIGRKIKPNKINPIVKPTSFPNDKESW